MSDIEKLVRPEIQNLATYRLETEKTDSIALHKNENPWNDFAFANVTGLNRYPEPQPLELLNRLAELFSQPCGNILLARGSDEGIDSLIKLFCSPCSDAIMICPPTFAMYEISASLQSVGVEKVPLLKENFNLDLEGIDKAMNEKIKIIFICSPNNPTGNITNKETVANLCNKFRGNAIIAVDEAYFDFSDKESCLDLLRNFENLVIFRTLSKAYGLAAIRCGMTIANAQIISLLQKIITPYPISLLTSLAAQTVLTEDNLQRIKQRITTIKLERQHLMQALMRYPFVEKVWPSEANFLLIKLKKNTEIKNYCFTKGILVRDVGHQIYLDNCVRITIGTPEENRYLLRVLGEM